MTSRFPPFAFVELVSPYNKKNITRWLEDMNFMFSWQVLATGTERKIHIFSPPYNILFLCTQYTNVKSTFKSSAMLSVFFLYKENFNTSADCRPKHLYAFYQPFRRNWQLKRLLTSTSSTLRLFGSKIIHHFHNSYKGPIGAMQTRS